MRTRWSTIVVAPASERVKRKTVPRGTGGFFLCRAALAVLVAAKRRWVAPNFVIAGGVVSGGIGIGAAAIDVGAVALALLPAASVADTVTVRFPVSAKVC